MRISNFEDLKLELDKTKVESLEFLDSIKQINTFIGQSNEPEKEARIKTMR